VAVLSDLNSNGKISDEMLLEILRRGEILPDGTNVEEEAAKITEPTPTPAPTDVVDNTTVE
jgi:hypothetical protein